MFILHYEKIENNKTTKRKYILDTFNKAWLKMDRIFYKYYDYLFNTQKGIISWSRESNNMQIQNNNFTLNCRIEIA